MGSEGYGAARAGSGRKPFPELSMNLDFESATDPEPEGLSTYNFAAIVCIVVAFWYGVGALYFYGSLRKSVFMLVCAAILTCVPCVVVGVLRYREIHYRCVDVTMVAAATFASAISGWQCPANAH